jgi:GR25 family glycosyltransferase involved in LPS biosynthesis
VAKDILSMFSVGALGCAMSNIVLWDKAIANNKTVTICEDDAVFNDHFEERAEDLLKGLLKD